ncbi:MAG: methylmalonyl-CoA mutase, partial [Synergistaceae bacterium]|nr:methylmalonyl-CoA mutase [Synergistaceae bacterium]
MESEVQKNTLEIPPVEFDEFSPPPCEEWRSEAEAAPKGAAYDKKMYSKTYEGITLEPLYTAERAKGGGYEGAFPGIFPFLRGSDAGGYLTAPWQIAQAVDASLPEDANLLLRDELEKGSTCAHLILDRPSLCGATDDVGERGRGLSICTLQD